MLDRLALPALPVLRGRVILRGSVESHVDGRVRHPTDPREGDGYGSSRRREWDGERYHTRKGAPSARVCVTSRGVTGGTYRARGVVCPSFLDASSSGLYLHSRTTSVAADGGEPDPAGHTDDTIAGPGSGRHSPAGSGSPRAASHPQQTAAAGAHRDPPHAGQDPPRSAGTVPG